MHQIESRVQPPDGTLLAEWKAAACHSHHLRAGELEFADANRNLVSWCRTNSIRAAGVGSPWTPVSADHYRQYEGPDRDLYYSGSFDQRSVMDVEDIAGLFSDLNSLSDGEVLLFQDNETPKGRNGHCWWFGYHYDFPAWHDYSQDRPIQYYDGDPQCEINAISREPHRRRSSLEIFAAQRRGGALGVWAHPTSWWLTEGNFTTNIAADCGLHLLADGYLDGLVNMGYRALRPSYQELWFHFLDTGAKVPGFAENDCAHDTPKVPKSPRIYKNSFHLPDAVSVDTIVNAAGKGASFSSTGAFASICVDGVPMGSVCETGRDRKHRLAIRAWPASGDACFSRLEIIGRGGAVLARAERFAGGRLEYEFAGDAHPGYIVVRGFGERDDPDDPDPRRISHLVITNPVYLHPRGFRVEPMKTDYTLEVTSDSPWLGGRLTFEEADGTPLESRDVRPGPIRLELPASARVRLEREVRERVFYVAMENPPVQDLLRYLWAGGFRQDYPDAIGGVVPHQAWRLDEMRDALQNCRYRV